MLLVIRRWPVPAAAGDRDIAGPQRCHPECILLLGSAAKCTLNEWSNQAYVAREGMRNHMYSSFKWKPSPWLRKPCSFLHLWMLVLFGWMLGKILLNYTAGRSIAGLAGKKMRPMLLKSLCLPIKLKGFGSWWFFWFWFFSDFSWCIYGKGQGRLVLGQIYSPQDIKHHLACWSK